MELMMILPLFQRLCKQVLLYLRDTYLLIMGPGRCLFGSVKGVPNHMYTSALMRSTLTNCLVTRLVLGAKVGYVVQPHQHCH